jgi:asparagine synthase (glutamine-hydrolysing)
LDYDFVEWGSMLPIKERFDYVRREGKQPARRYLASRIPARVLDRRKKGFTPPLGRWLEGPLRDRRVQALDELSAGDLAPLVIPSACKNWDECSELLCDTHQQFLWRIVCFSGWKAARGDTLQSNRRLQQSSRS